MRHNFGSTDKKGLKVWLYKLEVQGQGCGYKYVFEGEDIRFKKSVDLMIWGGRFGVHSHLSGAFYFNKNFKLSTDSVLRI